MKGREKIFFPSSTSRLSSRAAIFTRTRVYCSLIIPEVDEGPKLTKSSCSLLISLFSTVNSELKKLYLWLASNKLALNTKKPILLFFILTRSLLTTFPNLRSSILILISTLAVSYTHLTLPTNREV